MVFWWFISREYLPCSHLGKSAKMDPKAVKPVSPSKRTKIDARSLELAPGGISELFKSMESKMLRKKPLTASHRSSLAGHGLVISGLASAKDRTSNRTPPTERLREPLISKGRKELLTFVHEAMQSRKQELAGVPAYKRKRIAAPPATMGRKIVVTAHLCLFILLRSLFLFQIS